MSENPFQPPQPEPRPAKGWRVYAARICLVLVLLFVMGGIRSIQDGKLPADPARRQGYIAAQVAMPAIFVAIAIWFYRSRKPNS